MLNIVDGIEDWARLDNEVLTLDDDLKLIQLMVQKTRPDQTNEVLIVDVAL